MAFPAFESDLISLAESTFAAGYLYLSFIAWTMVYNTIYAAQDRKYDVKAGIKSPVVRHQANTQRLLVGFVAVQIGLLYCVGFAIEATAVYFVSTCLNGSGFIGE